MTGQHDAAEIRRVLRENNIDVSDRGKISQDKIDQYEQITGAVTDGDFGPDGDGGDVSRETDDGGEPLQPERVPGKIQGEPATARARRIWNRRNPKGKRKPARRRSGSTASRAAADRLPVGALLERMWLEFAHAARNLPPLQKVLVAQAPMIGTVLEDATRDTIADRALLQPFARQEDRLEKVNATIGTALWVTMITRWGAVELEQAADDRGRALVDSTGAPIMTPVINPDTGRPLYDDRTKIMIGGLRLSVMSWLRISQASAAEIQARASELTELSDQADKLIEWFLAPPEPGQRFRDMQREARQYANEHIYHAAPAPDVSRETGPGPAPSPAPATPGGQLVPVVSPLPSPDARTMRFVPPDKSFPSQVVPPAPMPQG
jgi:hypothetical protein